MKWVVMGLALSALAAGGVTGKTPAYDDYAAVLARFVDGEGLVDYAGLKRARAPLDAFVESLEKVSPAAYDAWGERERVAFWINAYNALTLKLVVDHYPIAPEQPRPGYPARSIRQIPGVWDEKKLQIMGRTLTLDQIEHKILRGEFEEPRIHMALVCAAVSCPRLRAEPYRGDSLDAQLDDQTRAFFADLRKFHVDRESGEVWASAIFEWFAEDFLTEVSPDDVRFEVQRKAVRAFAPKYVSEADREFLKRADFKLAFFEYDWTLNEQGSP
jgi:hypothetical protein